MFGLPQHVLIEDLRIQIDALHLCLVNPSRQANAESLQFLVLHTQREIKQRTFSNIATRSTCCVRTIPMDILFAEFI